MFDFSVSGDMQGTIDHQKQYRTSQLCNDEPSKDEVHFLNAYQPLHKLRVQLHIPSSLRGIIMGVSNCWTGVWNGMMKWKMEWNSEHTQL